MSGSSKAAVRAVQAGLRAASDAKLAEVIAMVDALPERGEADRLVAPLRPRLATLRPARPLRFSRLLFLPVDGALVDTPRWRLDTPTIPRGAIQPLADAVSAALGDTGRDIAVMIAGQTTASRETVLRAGAILWPLAAKMLPTVAKPAAWSQSGLPDAVFGTLCATLAAMLRPADKVAVLRDEVARGMALDEARLGEILRDTAAQGPAAWQAVTPLLMMQLPEPAMLLRAMAAATRGGDPALRVAGEQAADAILRRLDGVAASGGLLRAEPGTDAADTALAELARVGDLLTQLEESSAGPERRQLIGQVRANVGKACQDWIAGQLHDVLQPALRAGLGSEPGVGADDSDAALDALEQAMRGLRAVETTGRRFGGAERYDRMLRAAGDELARMPTGPDISPADRARMMELLVGPDEALALLRRDSGAR